MSTQSAAIIFRYSVIESWPMSFRSVGSTGEVVGRGLWPVDARYTCASWDAQEFQVGSLAGSTKGDADIASTRLRAMLMAGAPGVTP